MGRTLLIAGPQSTWREWLKANRGDRDLICLDPSDPQQGIPGRLCLFRGEHPIHTRFYGSIDSQRSPHVIVSAAAALLSKAKDDAIIQLFAYRPTPLQRQTAMIVAELAAPERVMLAKSAHLSIPEWSERIQSIEIEDAVSAAVQHAQRKAQWLRLIEQFEDHEIDLKRTSIEGTRFGSGLPLTREERDRAGLAEAVHAEKCGSVLLVVSPTGPDEAAVGRALDVSGAGRAVFVEPNEYDNLLCAFARTGGEEIGMGLIQRIDWTELRAYVKATAVSPANVPILRIGSIKVDLDGRELGETRPWQI